MWKVPHLEITEFFFEDVNAMDHKRCLFNVYGNFDLLTLDLNFSHKNDSF